MINNIILELFEGQITDTLKNIPNKIKNIIKKDIDDDTLASDRLRKEKDIYDSKRSYIKNALRGTTLGLMSKKAFIPRSSISYNKSAVLGAGAGIAYTALKRHRAKTRLRRMDSHL